MTVEQITCTNGSLKDGSGQVTCESDDSKCYDNSYTYCRELTREQIAVLIAIGVVGLVVVSFLTYFLRKIPLIGGLGALAINLAVLVLIAITIYVVYNNYKAKSH